MIRAAKVASKSLERPILMTRNTGDLTIILPKTETQHKSRRRKERNRRNEMQGVIELELAVTWSTRLTAHATGRCPLRVVVPTDRLSHGKYTEKFSGATSTES